MIVKDYSHQVLEPIITPAFINLLEYDALPEAQYIEDQLEAQIHGTSRIPETDEEHSWFSTTQATTFFA